MSIRMTGLVRFVAMTPLAAICSLSATALADEIHVPGDWPTIQMAIAFATDGDVVIVHEGEYQEHIDLSGKAITLRSTDPTDSDVVWATRILGLAPIPKITCDSGEGADTLISGFTITCPSPGDPSGTGIYCDSTSPTVTYCVFYYNEKTGNGGGMYIDGGAPTIEHCAFSYNSASEDGGAIYCLYSDPKVTDCMFWENSAGEDGGAICLLGSNAIVTDCEFLRSSCGSRGGAMYNHHCEPAIINCSFEGHYDDENADSIAGLQWEMQDLAPATGACCLNGGCIVATEAACIDAGGTYMGDDTDCGDVTCPEPCVGDITGDEVVDVLDLLEVLSAWGPCV